MQSSVLCSVRVNMMERRPLVAIRRKATDRIRDTDEMCMTITCDLSCSPNFCLFVDHKVQSR